MTMSVLHPRRWALLVLLVAMSILAWAHLKLGYQLSIPSHLPLMHRKTVDEGPGKYLVDTPTCRIPNVDPFDASLRRFIRPPKSVVCDKHSPPLIYSDIDSVYFTPERQHLYGARPPVTNVACCTRDIFWRNDVNSSNDYDKIGVSSVCRPLHTSYTPTSAAGVEVTCVLGNKTVYRDYRHFVPMQPRLEKARIQRHPDHVKPSVLIFMFDSLSRLQFLRWFPRTRRLLNQRLQAFELGGLNKEGDNTFPNLVALLTGMGRDEMEKMCAPKININFQDPCPYIWGDFQRAGYRTALAEDSAFHGAFTYMKMGFRKQPTDYYTRPTAVLSDVNIAYNKKLNTNLCEGSRHSYETTFKFAHDIATRFADRPYWGLVAQSTYSHDFFNYPYFLDEPYHQMLEELLNRGALNNTVLITMGDHGMRWGEPRNTFIGALEERLPLMNIYFPSWMRQRYPVAFDNLRFNQKRLTSFRDIYATMKALLRADQELGTVDEKEAPANASYVSLFRRVSAMRKCEDVGISAHYCTCLTTELLTPDDPRAQAAARAVVSAINEQLQAVPQCSRLRLGRVLSARIAHQPSANLVDINRHQMTTVQLQTMPGRARFEASVIVEGKSLEIGGVVSRLDRYGHLTWCIQDYILEKYCHCRKGRNAFGNNTAEPGGDLAKPNTEFDSSNAQSNDSKLNTSLEVGKGASSTTIGGVVQSGPTSNMAHVYKFGPKKSASLPSRISHKRESTSSVNKVGPYSAYKAKSVKTTT